MQSSVTHLSGAVDCTVPLLHGNSQSGELKSRQMSIEGRGFQGISKEQHKRYYSRMGEETEWGLNKKKPCQFGERKGKIYLI